MIDLGYCLNLTDSSSSDMLRCGYRFLKIQCETTNSEMPSNKQRKNYVDVLMHNLDCAVIEHLHEYDSVRGMFLEGEAPYPGSVFKEKTHIQISASCILRISGVSSMRAEAVRLSGKRRILLVETGSSPIGRCCK